MTNIQTFKETSIAANELPIEKYREYLGIMCLLIAYYIQNKNPQLEGEIETEIMPDQNIVAVTQQLLAAWPTIPLNLINWLNTVNKELLSKTILGSLTGEMQTIFQDLASNLLTDGGTIATVLWKIDEVWDMTELSSLPEEKKIKEILIEAESNLW